MCIDDYILEHPIEFRGVFIGKDIVSTFTKRRKKMVRQFGVVDLVR